MQSTASRLVIVSNRLPLVIHEEDGRWTAHTGSGGLVHALDPLLRQRGGFWVGWPGIAEDEADARARDATGALLEQAGKERGYRFVPVSLRADLVRDFYGGFANEVLWPLFHNLDDRCVFDAAYWRAYVEANERFADAIVSCTTADDFVWVQDYQLIMVARHLRRNDDQRRVGFFLHIPFPPLESFLKLPWRAEILLGLLDYDLVGLQTERDRQSFLDCVRRLLPGAEIRFGAGGEHAQAEVELDGRVTRVGTFPIGIDFERMERHARGEDVQAAMRRLQLDLSGRAVILGVDRLDYTKGIPERLLAFQHLLASSLELRERVTLLQIVEPSRELVPEYQGLKERIDQLVGAINGDYGTPGWVPIRYLYRSVGWPDLLALYRVARVGLVTPLKDGMNLVAKEYCACQIDEPGVLVLSEFAGSAAQLHEHALVVNPYDIEGTGRALQQALTLGEDARRSRMNALREIVAKTDVFWWMGMFLDTAQGGTVPPPPMQEFMPNLEREVSG
jgi:trehalose 6-phosphate synthase